LVFIGKNLDPEGLKMDFQACLATEENLKKKMKKLRYAIGDSVKCNIAKEWKKGKVVKLMYRDESMPPGMVAPYQVQLDGGDLIYVPADDDDCVKRA